MTRSCQFLSALGGVILILNLASCAQTFTKSAPTKTEQPGISERDAALIQRELVPHPLPQDPVYVRVKQACFFFAPHPEDGSMIPVGVLQPNSYIILRQDDGAWLDIQLTSGQLGSVLSNNIRRITSAEDQAAGYLAPQPELAPLSVPQADTSTIDTTLLGS